MGAVYGMTLALVNRPLFIRTYQGNFITNMIIPPIALFAARSMLSSKFESTTELQPYLKSIVHSYEITTIFIAATKVLGASCISSCIFVNALIEKDSTEKFVSSIASLAIVPTMLIDAAMDIAMIEHIPDIVGTLALELVDMFIN